MPAVPVAEVFTAPVEMEFVEAVPDINFTRPALAVVVPPVVMPCVLMAAVEVKLTAPPVVVPDELIACTVSAPEVMVMLPPAALPLLPVDTLPRELVPGLVTETFPLLLLPKVVMAPVFKEPLLIVTAAPAAVLELPVVILVTVALLVTVKLTVAPATAPAVVMLVPVN